MKRFLVVAALSVCSIFAKPVVDKGGDVIQLSTGETVKIGYYHEITLDSAKSPTSTHTVVFFQSSSGETIGMDSTQTPSGKVESTIGSVNGNDKITFETDLGFRHKGLPVPTTIGINGERVSLLLDDDPSGQHGKQVRAQLAPRVAKLSPGFVSALHDMARLGIAGYSGLGTGWLALIHIFDPADVGAPGLRIVSQSPMGEADKKMIGDALHHR
jgi:hypothetical protein